MVTPALTIGRRTFTQLMEKLLSEYIIRLLEKPVFVHDDLTAWNNLDMRFRIPEAVIGIIRQGNAGVRWHMLYLPRLVSPQLHEDFLGIGRLVQNRPPRKAAERKRIEVETQRIQQQIHVSSLGKGRWKDEVVIVDIFHIKIN